jgi:tetratricopeptide (TPR) repeat protein
MDRWGEVMDDRIALGIKHYNSKRYEKALAEFQSSDVDPAENSDLAYYIGLTLTKLEKYDDALIYLEQVVTSHKSFLHVYQSRMILGYIYAITNRYRLAEFEFQKLLDAGLESTQIYASMGYIYYSQGKTHESVEYLEKALALDPLYANALNSLGYIYAEEETELVKALEYCKKASELKPENSAYLDSLGWACYKLGDYREARRCLRKALDLSPGNKEIARHLKTVMEKNKYL